MREAPASHAPASRSGVAARFWATLVTLGLPIALTALALGSWEHVRYWRQNGGGQLLVQLGLAATGTACFIALSSRLRSGRHARPMALALPFLWIAVTELTRSVAAMDRVGGSGAAVMVRVDIVDCLGLALTMLLGLDLRRGRHDDRRLARQAFIVGAAAISVPWALSRLEPDPTLGDHLVSGIGFAAVPIFLFVATTFVRRWRDGHSPLDIALAYLATSHIVVQGLLIYPVLSIEAQIFISQLVRLGGLLAALTALVATDLMRIRESLLPRIRLSFTGLLAIVFVVTSLIMSRLAHAHAGTSLDRAAADVDPAAHVYERSVSLLVTLVLVFSGGVMLIVTQTSRRFVHDVRRILKGVRDFAYGRSDLRVHVDEADETGGLSLSFNAMAERISLQGRELRILKQVMEGTNEPVLVINHDHRIVYMNDAFEEATGWSRRLTIARPLGQLFTGRANQRKLERMRHRVESGRAWSGEVSVRGRAGRAFDSILTVTPTKWDADGVDYVAVFRDLRTLKKLESERVDFTRNLLKMHKVGQTMLESLELDEIYDRVVGSLHRYFGLQSRIWMLDEGDQCPTCSLAARCRDTSACFHLVRRHPDDGKAVMTRLPLGVGCTGRAAAERDRFVCLEPAKIPYVFEHEPEEARLEGARAAFPMMVKGELLGVLEVGLPQPENGRLLDSLQLLVQILAESISNATLHARTTRQAAALERLTSQLEGAAKQQKSYADELRRINRKLVESDRVKSRFLSTTSHELKTPLCGSLGFLELVLDGMTESHDEELEFVREAHQCAQNLLRIINEVLDIAKIEAGRMPVEVRPVDLRALFDEIASTAVAKAKGHDGGLEVTFDCEEDCAIMADYKRALQALSQVVGNAIKFAEGGSVAVRARSRPERGFVEITVEDDGIGIEEADLERVFEAFVQLDADDDRRFGGSGLGLTLTREIVGMLGGIVRLESDGLGRGARAVLTFPIHREVEPARVSASPAAPDAPVVLLVDSDEAFLAEASERIGSLGGVVRIARSAAEAFEIATTLLPDWVLTEYSLPYVSQPDLKTGADLARRLVTGTTLRESQVAIVTGHDFGKHPLADDLTDLPAVRRLHKPLRENELAELLVTRSDIVEIDRPVRVLLVDDDPGIAEGVRHALRGSRFQVECLRDGEAALTSLSRPESAFDLLLLDLLMPGISGYEVLHELTHGRVAPDLPVIVLSNDFETTDENERELLTNANVFGVVSKDQIAAAPHRLARTALQAVLATVTVG